MTTLDLPPVCQDVDLPDSVRRLIPKLPILYPINRIILYGSRARKDQKYYSDIDLAFDAPDMTDDDFLDMSYLLDAARTLYKIDYVHLQRTKGPFRENVMNDGVVLYEKI